MIRTALIVLACLAGCAGSSRQYADSERAVAIFDGRTLAGWTQRGGKAEYRVEVVDGVPAIVGLTRPNQPNSFLCTNQVYRDFVLELEFKVDPTLNSGVQIRSESRPDYQNGRVHGYQVEIDPSERAWTGGIYDEGRRGWLADLKSNDVGRAAFKSGEWNHFRIVASGDSIRVWLNGVQTAELRDSMTPEGYIALQVHGVGASTDERRVMWRKLSVAVPAQKRSE